MNIKFKPFNRPTEAFFDLPEGTKINGFLPHLPIDQIPIDDLVELCDQWRESVFKAAGKTDPIGQKTYGIDGFGPSQDNR